LEAEHPDVKAIHVIVDNATYYKSLLVKGYLETSRIKIHFLHRILTVALIVLIIPAFRHNDRKNFPTV